MDNSDLVGVLRSDPAKLTDHELLYLDFCLHYAWRRHGDGNTVHFPTSNRNQLIELHIIVRKTMGYRGFQHLVDDGLDAESAVIEHQRRTTEAGFLRGAAESDFMHAGDSDIGG